MDPYSHHHYTTSYPPQNPNPNPNPNQLAIEPYKPQEPQYLTAIDTGLRPPGTVSDPSINGYEAQQHGVVYAQHHHPQTVDLSAKSFQSSSSSYYQDPNSVAAAYYQDPNYIAAVQSWVANNLTLATPTGTEQLVPAYPNTALTNNATVQPHRKVVWKKGPKKPKIVQSAWCEVCRVDCNSKDVLEQHKMGKKHIKSMEKLKQAITPAPSASSQANNSIIGPQENPDKGKTVSGQKTKKVTEPVEDLETKKRKVLEGGADAEAVRTCAICNVVCNSVTVFKYHLIGQKHTSMMKKYAAAGTVLPTST